MPLDINSCISLSKNDILKNFNPEFINKLKANGLLENFVKEVQIDQRPLFYPKYQNIKRIPYVP